jgi:transposase, IS6 family
MRRRCRRVPAPRSSFAGFRFPPDVITIAVRWYLRYGLSYRDVEELLAERGVEVDRSRLIHTPRYDLPKCV